MSDAPLVANGHMWNGSEWVPLASPEPAPPPASGSTTVRRIVSIVLLAILAVPVLFVLVFVVGGFLKASPAQTTTTNVAAAPSPSQEPVGELGKSACKAANHTWTRLGCRTENEVQQMQEREWKKMKAQGWERFGGKAKIDGIYRKNFTKRKYEGVLADPRCANYPSCVAFRIRTDSLTACPERFLVEGNVLKGKVIMGSAQGKARSLPADSVAQLILPIRVDLGYYKFGEAALEFTRTDCT